MDRNNEIIRLAKKAADAWRNTDTYHQAAQIIDMLISALEGEPTLPPPNEWMSVEERLPEHCKVLVTDGKKVVLSNGAWIYRSTEGELRVPGNYGAGLTVTHWMKLPEPPDRRPPEGEEDI